MSKISSYLQEELGYSNYQVKLLRYYFKSLLYEVSKFIMMGIFFLSIGYFIEYLISVIALLTLRTSLGGLHFKTYMGCFIFTLIFFIVNILFLSQIIIPKPLMIAVLLLCILITNIIGPITSIYRKAPNEAIVKKIKLRISILIFICCLLICIIPTIPYINQVVWIIITQTLQLIAAYTIKKGENTNETED